MASPVPPAVGTRTASPSFQIETFTDKLALQHAMKDQTSIYSVHF